MLHLGDITKIDGSKIPKVDVITFGAPCQDLSVAGKRKGMKHEAAGDDETTRSGLFFEAIRVIKEMREDDRNNGRTGEFIRPRYAVYENVPGAFSSNKGSDFQAVLTEIVKVVQDCPDVPMPKNGWPKSGCIYDELGTWSIAWRVHDAQFCGVPQRRKRIALIADFAGRSAPEILFERKGLQGDFTKSEREEPNSSERTGRSVNESDRGECLNPFDIQSKQVQPESGIANALYAGECRYGGVASYGMKDETIAIEGNGSRQSHHGDGYRKTDKMYSLNTVETHAVCSYQERAGKPGGAKAYFDKKIMLERCKPQATSS